MKTVRGILFLLFYLSAYIAQGQVEVRMSSIPIIIGESLSIDGIDIEVISTSSYEGEVYVKVFADRFQTNLIATSAPILINKSRQKFYLQEIFSSKSFLWKDNQSTLCLQVVSRWNDLPLSVSCFEVDKNKKKITKENKKKKLPLSANIIYENETFTNNKEVPVTHSLDYSGQMNIGNVPIVFRGFFQNNNDPYLDQNPSNFTINFDVHQWRSEMMNKVKKENERIKDSITLKYPEYQRIYERGKYLDKVFSSKSYLKDMQNIDSLSLFLKKIGLENGMQTSADSFYQFIDDKEKDLSKNNFGNDSLYVGLLENVEKVKDLYLKYQSYRDLTDIKQKSASYLSEAKSEIDDNISLFREHMENPQGINKFLDEKVQLSSLDKILNHISALKIGNVNHQFSRLVLQNSQIRGAQVGVEYSNWEVSSFYGKLRSRSLSIGNIDTTTLKPVDDVMGIKVGYNVKNSSRALFGVFGNRDSGVERTNTMIGYTSSEKLSDNSMINFDMVWSGLGGNQGVESNDNNFIKEMSSWFEYIGETKNNVLTWSTSVEYYGRNYYDISNPFLVNNSLTTASNLFIKPVSFIRLGGTFLMSDSELWESNSIVAGKTIGYGGRLDLIFKKLPLVKYIYNRSVTDSKIGVIYNDFHNINLTYNLNVKNFNTQTLVNVAFLKNTSEVDTVNSETVSIVVSERLGFSNAFSIVGNLSYTNTIKEFEASDRRLAAEILCPIILDKITIRPGLKFVQDTIDQIGYEVLVSWNVSENFTVQASYDSLWYRSVYSDVGELDNQYIPRLNTRLKYFF